MLILEIVLYLWIWLCLGLPVWLSHNPLVPGSSPGGPIKKGNLPRRGGLPFLFDSLMDLIGGARRANARNRCHGWHRKGSDAARNERARSARLKGKSWWAQ